ncbi:Aerolysin-like protein [Anabarilius grahami]|uniref:Aerolysin-like protein n=1 Tax=Anabarilius grahami TaxID=495550 RepID=A0A3N0YY83_ANAGA|nr:Aerolysin-like protein [Anabarilius grahami]
MVGGTGGYKTSFITPSISSIKKIRIHYEEEVLPYISVVQTSMTPHISKFKAIQVFFSAGYEITIGDTSTGKIREFLFADDDQIVSAKLWPNKNKDRVRGLEFVVAKSNGARRTFSIKAKDVGSPVTVDVKSGKCYGIVARFANEIDQLGFYFI